MTYYIWFDESDKEGEFYSNFYGGILIKSLSSTYKCNFLGADNKQ